MKKLIYMTLINQVYSSQKILLTTLLVGFGAICAFSQTVTITGTVTDNQGLSVIGANILEKGTTNGAITDLDGVYSIDVAKGGKLVFSYVGYNSKEITVGDKSTINVTLSVGTALDEVVVIGYGTRKKSDLTGAVSSVSQKDFEKQPLFRLEDALVGRVSGVQIDKNSGAPGADLKIRVRGSNSINGNNQPLVVVDGIIGADLRSINSNDIQSIEILKDASSTAIYGVRGSNGVILVSTKKGSGKPRVDLQYFNSTNEIPKYLDLLSANEFAEINGITEFNGVGTDYQKEYFQTARTNNLQLSLNGKSDNIGYFISGNYVNQNGIDINSAYKRYSLRTNLNADVNDKFSFGLNVFGSIEDLHNLVSGGARTSSDRRAGIAAVVGWDPTTPVLDENGRYNLMSPYATNLINPVAVRRESDRNATINRVNANLNANYKLSENLTFSTIGGILHRNAPSQNYRGIIPGTVILPESGGFGFTSGVTLQNTNSLTFNKDIGKNNINLMAAFEVSKITTKTASGGGGPQFIPYNYYAINLGTQPSVRSGLSERTLRSWLGRAEYIYDNKLWITGTLRRDESSVFRPENQVGIFPSGAIKYDLGDLFPEDFFVENLRLRFSYGVTGSQGISPYSTYTSVSENSANYPIDGLSESVGIQLGGVGNPNLKWETTNQTNFGIDFAILKGRFNITAEAYWKNTEDLLLSVPIPLYEGGGSIRQNIGKVSNKGFEFSIYGSIINSGDFLWTSSFNLTGNRNKVVSLAGDQNQIVVNPAGSNSNSSGGMGVIRVGDPLGQFLGATFLGTYKTGDADIPVDAVPGDAKYLLDENGDLVIDIIGNGNPDLIWGFNNTFTYGRFDLNFLLSASQGFDVLNLTRGFASLTGGAISNATFGEFRNRWTPENETDIPATGQNIINSTRYIEDGSFIRLRNLSLGYDFKDMIKGARSLKLYISAQNLFTITDYTGYDPEVSSTSASSDQGASIDWGAYPNPRTFTIGLNLGL
jgi:TonB-linked SusC/RagA family outer membrane protein